MTMFFFLLVGLCERVLALREEGGERGEEVLGHWSLGLQLTN